MFPKRGAVALVTTVLALVLLISFKTPDQASTGTTRVADGSARDTTADVGAAAPTSRPTASLPSSGGAGSGSAANPGPTSATGAITVTGSSVSTRWGDVQVQATIENGKITDVQALALPAGGRSGEISDYVEPVLANEALQAQSAQIDIISGATYTSRAYARSLQSALDQAAASGVVVAG